jgi:Co/Zn/Cd efflux system component
MSNCGCELEARNYTETVTLRIVLLVNAAMFAVESVTGWLAHSSGLIADSLDMLADAMVYGISLYAIGRNHSMKVTAASLSGALQIALGVGALIDVSRRLLSDGEPISELMIGIGLLALIANTICLRLIARHRKGDVNMRASWIFSRNDVIANLAVIIAGLLVKLSGSRLPDLVIGLSIAALVTKGGWQIIREAKLAATAAVQQHV